MARQDLSRGSAVLWVTAATLLGGAFRFYGLAWGAPYFHFHMDEHLVFQDAYLLAACHRYPPNAWDTEALGIVNKLAIK